MTSPTSQPSSHLQQTRTALLALPAQETGTQCRSGSLILFCHDERKEARVQEELGRKSLESPHHCPQTIRDLHSNACWCARNCQTTERQQNADFDRSCHTTEKSCGPWDMTKPPPTWLKTERQYTFPTGTSFGEMDQTSAQEHTRFALKALQQILGKDCYVSGSTRNQGQQGRGAQLRSKCGCCEGV
jgi:hypothetical protein